MRKLWRIFIYPFVFWSAVLLGVLDLPHSLHCTNHVAGLIQGIGKWFLREGGATEATTGREDGKNFLHQPSLMLLVSAPVLCTAGVSQGHCTWRLL